MVFDWTNNNDKITNKLQWQQNRFLPVATAAASAFCYWDDNNNRYMYYLVWGTFYQLDLWSNENPQELATYPWTNATVTALKYINYWGYRGNVLWATATTFDLAWLKGKRLKWYTVRIKAWTGAWQERTITDITEPTVYDWWIITAQSSTSITDWLKKWKINQRVWYQVRITYWTWVTIKRNVLYNTESVITFQDSNFQHLEPRQNIQLWSAYPETTLTSSWTVYQIEKSTATINTPRTVTPDTTSSFVVLTWWIRAISTTTSAPRSSYWYYDIASDMRVPKTNIWWQLTAAMSTEINLERFWEVWWYFKNWNIASATANTITVSWTPRQIDEYNNFQLRVYNPSWIEQRRRISCMTNNSIQVDRPFDTTPSAWRTYKIYWETNKMRLAWNGASILHQYSVEEDMRSQWHTYYSWVTSAWTLQFAWQTPFWISAGSRQPTSVTAVDSTPTAWGTNYSVWDILTISTGGTWAKIYVESILPWGIVNTVSLYACWNGYTTWTGKATTWGTGSGCTVNITSVWVTVLVTLNTSHNLIIWDSVTVKWLSEAAYNTTSTILWTPWITQVEYITTATWSMSWSFAQSTTLIVDANANRGINELAWKIIAISTGWVAPTHQFRVITSNTATTITVPTIVAASNGSSRYIIYDQRTFGRAEMSKIPARSAQWHATWWSTTTLIDTTRNWIPNQRANFKFYIKAWTWAGNTITITSNTSNTLTYSTQSFTPDATTCYYIQDSRWVATSWTTTTIVDSTKNWPTNIRAWRYVKIISGTWAMQVALIASNTSNTLTVWTITAPDTTSAYTILEVPPRWAWCDFVRAFGWTYNKWKYAYSLRWAATNQLDRYNIAMDTFEPWYSTYPRWLTFSTGTMTAYDWDNWIYIHKDATWRIFKYSLDTNMIDWVWYVPWNATHSTAIIGNRMEIVYSPKWVKFIYIAAHSNTPRWRCMLHNDF